MSEPRPDVDARRPAGFEMFQEDPWTVLDRIRPAFADVPEEVHEAEVDRIIAEIRAEARADAASKRSP